MIYTPYFFILLLFNLISFVVAVAIILRMVIVYLKHTSQYQGKLYKLPKFFPNIKHKTINQLINFAMLNIVLIWVMIFGVPIVGGSQGIGIETLTFEKLVYYIGISLFISLLMIGIFYFVENSKITSAKLIMPWSVPWYWELIFWGIVLVMGGYFGFCIQDNLWQMYHTAVLGG